MLRGYIHYDRLYFLGGNLQQQIAKENNTANVEYEAKGDCQI